jgi:hypothetical protein
MPAARPYTSSIKKPATLDDMAKERRANAMLINRLVHRSFSFH